MNDFQDSQFREHVMKLLENQARLETKLDTKLDHLEELLKDNKKDVDDMDYRLRDLEARQNKFLGIGVAVSFAVPFIILLIKNYVTIGGPA